MKDWQWKSCRGW